MALVDGNAAKRGWFSLVCSANVLSTRKPRSASLMAGLRVWPRVQLPHRRRALSHVAGVPGTPTETPLVTSSGVKL